VKGDALVLISLDERAKASKTRRLDFKKAEYKKVRVGLENQKSQTLNQQMRTS
jgi:hypothetical protein